MDSTHTPSAVPACAGLCEKLDAVRGVTRRDFVSAAALASVVALFEACGSSGGPTSPAGSGGPLTVKLSDFSALASVGGVAQVDRGIGSPTALVRTGTSSFVALSMICPHQGSTIGYTGTSWRCPNHLAQFSTTGSWIGGQQTNNLTSFTTTFDAVAGTVLIARPG